MAKQSQGFRASIATVGIVGTGVIGSGWAARFLPTGLDVVAYDPAPGAEAKMRAFIDNAWVSLEQLGLSDSASRTRLTFVPELVSLCERADYIQESAPEHEDLKIELHANLDKYAPPDVLLASSSSGLLPSRIQARCTYPQRVLIAHPFNPVYLLPLVEILGGEQTSSEALETANIFLRDCAMYPLKVDREIEGYLSDRLQEALWRENLHLVNEDVADTAALDDAIVYGPGLRWALMGVNKTFHLAGGEAGMRHMLEQFGPALKLPWTKLDAPELTADLIDKMVAGTHDQAQGQSVQQLERMRDDCLVAIMTALARFDVGAGRVLNENARKSLARSPRFTPGSARAEPLELYQCRVRTDWIDYNDHMTDAAYLTAFAAALERLLHFVGCDEEYRKNVGAFYTAETHIRYHHECKLGESLNFCMQILDVDEKRLHVFMSMFKEEGGALAATTEQILLHVGSRSGKTAPMGAVIHGPFVELAKSHAELPRPADSGRHVSMNRAG